MIERVLSAQAAVDADRLARDVAGVLRREVGDQRRHLRAASPCGRPAAPASTRSSTPAGIARTASVSTKPGRTAFAVMPRATFSAAIVRTIPITPAFEAL